MQSEIFLAFQGSSKLLMLFETDWARLSEEQKHKLLLAIEKSYDRFTDPMSWFIGSELLGEYYCHEDAFEVLRRLKQTTNINARALIPHGFEHLIKGAKDLGLRTRAFAELRSLLNDPSENVRAEAAESLSRLPQT